MFLFYGMKASIGPGLPYYRVFTITLIRITVARTPPDKWSARRRDLYLTTHNTHTGQTSIPTGRFRTRNPSKLVAAEQRLRPRGHWDWLVYIYIRTQILSTFVGVINDALKLLWLHSAISGRRLVRKIQNIRRKTCQKVRTEKYFSSQHLSFFSVAFR